MTRNRREAIKLGALAQTLVRPERGRALLGRHRVADLGAGPAPAAEQLAAVASRDPSPRVRVPAAEALVRIGRVDEGAALLGQLAAEPSPVPVRLMAMNALGENREAARKVLPVIERAADSDGNDFRDDYVKDAAIHLASVLKGTYDPGKQPRSTIARTIGRWRWNKVSIL